MALNKTLEERGKFKQEIHAALYKSDEIKELLLGDISGKTSKEVLADFQAHVKSHLFIDDTIADIGPFIFYDVVFPSLHTNIKNCNVLMYCICERTILDDYSKPGYYGNRMDILSEMVADVLVNDDKTANSFGIGRLILDSITVYNSQRFYGCTLSFSVPTFR